MAHVPTQDGRTSNRGFASMNQERQRQIASMGGKAVPDEKRSFSQNRRLAAEAGRKGGGHLAELWLPSPTERHRPKTIVSVLSRDTVLRRCRSL